MTRNAPEARLQMDVKTYLGWCLPSSIIWTANAAGVTLGKTKEARLRQGAKSKAMGVQKGWSDLQFLFPDGVTRFIELKTDVGTLRPEQRDFRDRCYAAERTLGFPIWSVCRSLEEVDSVLRSWGAEMKAHPFGGFRQTGEAA